MAIVPANQSDRQTPVPLHVDGVDWLFSINTVRRVGRDLFIQVDLEGPDRCLATVHVRDGIVLGTTARQILTAACEWLRVRGTALHTFIDLSAPVAPWPATGAA